MSNQVNSRNEKFPLENITFDVLTVLNKKSRALEALNTYIKDAQNHQEVRQLLESIRSQEEQQVEQLRNCLSQLLGQQYSQQGQQRQQGSGVEKPITTSAKSSV